MIQNDLELAAVCTFLNELSLDEIIRCGGGATGGHFDRHQQVFPAFQTSWSRSSDFQSDESICSWEDDDRDNDELAREWSIAGVTSSEGSDSDDLQEQHAVAHSLATTKAKRLRTESQRELQRSYDRKFRTNKRVRRSSSSFSSFGTKASALGVLPMFGPGARRLAGCETFIAALQELTVLMQFRIARTEKEIHLLCLAKKKGGMISTHECALRQLERNQGVVQCIQSCTSSWRQEKSGELGKYFLRDQAKTIQALVDKLLDLRTKLEELTEELRWRVEEETTGVWV